MIIVRAPYRVSLFGGGSDYPSFIDKYGYGIVVSFAIDKYCYITINNLLSFHNYKTLIRYDKTERVRDNKYIYHPIIRNCVKFVGLTEESLEISHLSDVIGSSGLGTSSTMIVTLLEALKQYKYGRGYLPDYQLFDESSYIEQTLMGESVGFQDYLPAIDGGCNYYKLVKTSQGVRYEDFQIIGGKFRKLINKNGLLFFTGITRKSSDVVGKYIGNTTGEAYQLEIRNIAEQAFVEVSSKCRYGLICALLNESMRMKREMSPEILPPCVGKKMDLLFTAGADAVRLLGGGGGGSLFVLASEARRDNIIQEAQRAGMVHIPFAIANKGVERIL